MQKAQASSKQLLFTGMSYNLTFESAEIIRYSEHFDWLSGGRQEPLSARNVDPNMASTLL